MKAVLALTLAGAALAAPAKRADTVQGFDISHHQSTVDFKAAFGAGARFVHAKATEGVDFKDDHFAGFNDQARAAGIVVGAYHFAHPDTGSGAQQATYFVQNGGAWTNDNKTLPGMLDIEYNPKGDTCYGLTPEAMTAWLTDFVNTYHSLTQRFPIIYTTNGWWSKCTGNSNAFAATCPLNLARYSTAPGTLPGGWAAPTIWQNSDKYQFGGDSDLFQGNQDQLNKLVSG